MKCTLPKKVIITYHLQSDAIHMTHDGGLLQQEGVEPLKEEEIVGSGSSLEWLMTGADTLFKSGAEIVILKVGIGLKPLNIPYRRFRDEAKRDVSNTYNRVVEYMMDLTQPPEEVGIDFGTTKRYMKSLEKEE